VETALLAEIRPETRPPKPPTTDEPPGGNRKPTPTAPPVAPPDAVRSAPPSAKPSFSAPSQSAEPPKVAQVPKAAVPPTVVENPPVTDSEKENRKVSPVEQESNAQSEEHADLESKTEHETLKDEVQAHAESLDYTVTRETPIPQHGRPDLILTRGKHSIACEVSVTTHKTIEADHIRLRLKAGFTHVAVISEKRRKLPKIEASYLKLIPSARLDKVGFYSLDEFLSQLSAWAMDDPEGGALERAKPRKQNLGTKPPPKNPVEQAEVQQALLADLKKMMARDRMK